MSNIHELIEQKNKLQAEIDAIKNTEKQSVIDSIKASIQEFGITASELGFKGGKGKGNRGPVVDKYVSGINRWSGRGRAPSWVTAILEEKGITIEQFKDSSDWLI